MLVTVSFRFYEGQACPIKAIVPITGSHIGDLQIGIPSGDIRMGEETKEIFPKVVLSCKSASLLENENMKNIAPSRLGLT